MGVAVAVGGMGVGGDSVGGTDVGAGASGGWVGPEPAAPQANITIKNNNANDNLIIFNLASVKRD